MEGDGYRTDPEAFEQLTQGINAAMSELKELGFDIEAQLGRGFDRLSLDSVECGDGGLATVFSSFCDRWGWGVRTLMQDANTFSEKLGLTAGNYYEQEQYASDLLKQGVNAAVGDPTRSAEDLHKTSWSKLKDDVIDANTDFDYDPNSKASRESYQRVDGAFRRFGHDASAAAGRALNVGNDLADASKKIVEAEQTHGGGDK
ncbi:hypothetical protein GTY73_24775 [Streptomyces sp. SID8354]|nr:hypothetical protein [Streptomyces sp. SID8354]